MWAPKYLATSSFYNLHLIRGSPNRCHSFLLRPRCGGAAGAGVSVATIPTTQQESSSNYSVWQNVLADDESPSALHSRFLRCCEPTKKLKIAVLVSGGVDSSVALRLLCAAGHSCTAFYLKIWFQEDFQNFWSACPWDEDLKFAQAVCEEVKDQTYFLSHLSQEQLSRLIFPLGCIKKEEVRQLAHWMRLPNKDRKDSQGICFLGKVKFNDFIARHLGVKEGYLFEAETGECLGTHKGYWFYTIGQRQGLGLSHGPWYVVDKDLENNVVFISRNYFSIDKRRCEFHVNSLNWLGGSPPSNSTVLRCKVRHGQKFYHCSLAFAEPMKNESEGSVCESFRSAFVKLNEDDQGIAAGQYVAFYDADVCLGSGIISDLFVGSNPCVSTSAREAARMTKVAIPVKKKLTKTLIEANAINKQCLTREQSALVKEMHVFPFKSWANKIFLWLGAM